MGPVLPAGLHQDHLVVDAATGGVAQQRSQVQPFVLRELVEIDHGFGVLTGVEIAVQQDAHLRAATGGRDIRL